MQAKAVFIPILLENQTLGRWDGCGGIYQKPKTATVRRPSRYSIFGIGRDRKHILKWLAAASYLSRS